MLLIVKVIVLCVGLFVVFDFLGFRGIVIFLFVGVGIVGFVIGFVF